VLVTGATGLIGHHLLPKLAPVGEVWATSRRLPASSRDDVRWILHDFARGTPPVGLPRRIDSVIHLAQATDYRDFPNGASQIYDVSAHATQQLLDWAYRVGARRFIFASTGGLYAPSSEALTETSPLAIAEDPLAFYLSAKRIGEMLAERYARVMTIVILRFFFVYGPGQRPNMLFPRLIASIQAGKPILLQGREGTRMNPIYVEDAARAIVPCLELTESATINIAGPEVVSMSAISGHIGEALGRRPAFTGDPAAAPSNLIGDIERMRARLGAPLIPPREGIRRMVEAVGLSAAGSRI